MNDPHINLTICDKEPIHVPGAIQPHGILLVVDPYTLTITHGAGAIEARLGRHDWQDLPVDVLLGEDIFPALRRTVAGAGESFSGGLKAPGSEEVFDVALHVSGAALIIELEPASTSSLVHTLSQIEAASSRFERVANIGQLYQEAATEFRRLTGYSRVMIYRFLDDNAGVVVGEDRKEGQGSFLNHHFPASDIPKQARALYLRNRVRVIPDVTYVAASLRPVWEGPSPLDMSDSVLRSVSPVHVQYLKNMGVGASASISIVKDGVLWGLVACHNDVPRMLPMDLRSACSALAGSLAMQIKAREETDIYRERVRLRSYEDDIVGLLSREGSLDAALSNHLDEIMKMLGGTGIAVLRGEDLVTGGFCPSEGDVRAIAAWALERSKDSVFATERLGEVYPLSQEAAPRAAGLLALTLSASDPWILLWFRAEELEIINWAGNPHKDMRVAADGKLNPRASFEAWSETVRGRARRWTLSEVEAAGRLRASVMNVWQARRLRDLNRQLINTLDEKEMLIRQKEFLIGEVNHRVQNSLQLVSSFLALQARASEDEKLHSAVEEARRRLSAVSLVHRRLYRSDQIEAVDAARYIEDLIADLSSSLGAEWESHIVRDLQPIILPTDRAISLGLIMTELFINANKYAYGGQAGPVNITLAQDRSSFRMTFADQGVGRSKNGRYGFGSRMMDALVMQLGGEFEFSDNRPGTCSVLTAPIGITQTVA